MSLVDLCYLFRSTSSFRNLVVFVILNLWFSVRCFVDSIGKSYFTRYWSVFSGIFGPATSGIRLRISDSTFVSMFLYSIYCSPFFSKITTSLNIQNITKIKYWNIHLYIFKKKGGGGKKKKKRKKHDKLNCCEIIKKNLLKYSNVWNTLLHSIM